MFITVEGIRGSGREVLIQKITVECEMFCNKKVIRVEKGFETVGVGEALDDLARFSNDIKGVRSKNPNYVFITSEYANSVFAFHTFGSRTLTEHQHKILDLWFKEWNVLRPDLSFYLDVPVEEARKRIMHASSDKISFHNNEEYCSAWDSSSESIKNRFDYVIARDNSNKTVNVSLKGSNPSKSCWEAVKSNLETCIERKGRCASLM